MKGSSGSFQLQKSGPFQPLPCDEQHAFLCQLATVKRIQIVAMTQTKLNRSYDDRTSHLGLVSSHTEANQESRAKWPHTENRRWVLGDGKRPGSTHTSQQFSIPEIPERSCCTLILVPHWKCQSLGSVLENIKIHKTRQHPSLWMSRSRLCYFDYGHSHHQRLRLANGTISSFLSICKS